MRRRASSTDNDNRVVATFAYGRHLWFLDEVEPVMRRWAERHGWDVEIAVDPRLAAGRPPAWAKVALLRELLERYRWAWFIDVDAVIVDLERDPMSDLDDSHDLFLAPHRQQLDESIWVPNFGVVLARSSDRTTAFLDAVWAAEQYTRHDWWDNAAVLDLLGYDPDPPYAYRGPTEWTDLVGELDLAWNSVPGYCEVPNPAVRHHARADHGSFDRRLAAIRADARAGG